MLTCKECGFECSAANALGYHLRKHEMAYGDYLVKHEHSGTWPVCKCGTKLVLKKGGFGRFCSKSCSSSREDNAMGRLKGENSPNFGKKRTTEQRLNYSVGSRKRWDLHGDKLREMMKTVEYKKAQSESQVSSWQNSPDRRVKTVFGVHRFWSSDSDLTRQRRKEASDRAIVQLELGQIGPHAPFKVELKHNPFTDKEERMHSSWESAFLDECVKHGIPVTKAHDLRIPYVGLDRSQHQYVPDFVDLEDGTVVEVKGHLSETDVIKLNALVEWAKTEKKRVVLWRPDGWETLWSPDPSFREGPIIHRVKPTE